MLIVDDTIVAIASPLSPAARGIVRISGPDTVSVLSDAGVQFDASLQAARRFEAAIQLASPLGNVDVFVMLWPTRRSYTGQPSAEVHTIGCLPILDAITQRLMESGARAARPGEFTMRSFLAGRLDLTQAEAVLGVIDAEDAGSLDQALSQLAGNLSAPLQLVRNRLLDLLADVEAGLDFVDEDIEFISDSDLVDRLQGSVSVLRHTETQLRDRVETKHCTGVILRGLPNAGKSCLVNALTSADTAIVTAQAGTTRDVLTVKIEMEGQPFSITDTAGIETRSSLDQEAEILAKAQTVADAAEADADICLWCVDVERIDAMDRRRSTTAKTEIVLATKVDLLPPEELQQRIEGLKTWGLPVLPISVVAGSGLEELRRRLVGIAARVDPTEVGSVIGTAARCRDSIRQAISGIDAAIEMTALQTGHELVAAEVRSAVQSLGEVTGEVYTDDILDRVFSRFCIGK